MSQAAVIAMRYALRRPSFRLDVDIEIPLHGITGVFGRSGAGKTSLLRCIAGLETPEEGRLVVAGDAWQDGRVTRPVHRRAIGYVFQGIGLFPHMTIGENIGISRFLRYEALHEGALAVYVHPPGKLGVILELAVEKPSELSTWLEAQLAKM